MLDQLLYQAINQPTYMSQFGIDMRIMETVAQFKLWVEFFKKYAPKLNRNGELDALLKKADNVMASYNSIYQTANLAYVQDESVKKAWLNGVSTDAGLLYQSLVNVLLPLYNYAASQAGANLVLIEGRKAQLNQLLQVTSPFDDAYAKYKDELDAYTAISKRLGNVSFELEGILGKEVYDKYYVPPVVATTTATTDTRIVPTTTTIAPTETTTVAPATATATSTTSENLATQTTERIVSSTDIGSSTVAPITSTITTVTEEVRTMPQTPIVPQIKVEAPTNTGIVPPASMMATASSPVASMPTTMPIVDSSLQTLSADSMQATVPTEEGFWAKYKWVVIGLIVLAAAGGGIWYYNSKK